MNSLTRIRRHLGPGLGVAHIQDRRGEQAPPPLRARPYSWQNKFFRLTDVAVGQRAEQIARERGGNASRRSYDHCGSHRPPSRRHAHWLALVTSTEPLPPHRFPSFAYVPLGIRYVARGLTSPIGGMSSAGALEIAGRCHGAKLVGNPISHARRQDLSRGGGPYCSTSNRFRIAASS